MFTYLLQSKKESRDLLSTKYLSIVQNSKTIAAVTIVALLLFIKKFMPLYNNL